MILAEHCADGSSAPIRRACEHILAYSQDPSSGGRPLATVKALFVCLDFAPSGYAECAQRTEAWDVNLLPEALATGVDVFTRAHLPRRDHVDDVAKSSGCGPRALRRRLCENKKGRSGDTMAKSGSLASCSVGYSGR